MGRVPDFLIGYLFCLIVFTLASVQAQACTQTSVGFTPLTDCAPGETYKGYPCRLTPSLEAYIQPINGRIVLASLGMSNAYIEFRDFQELAREEAGINPSVVLANLAMGGGSTKNLTDPNSRHWTQKFPRAVELARIDPAEVQVLWFKTAASAPKDPFPQHAQQLTADLHTILDIALQKMPNIKQVYVSSRIYAGYATNYLNPEPWAYESGFAYDWLVQDQHPGVFISWGPYLWADGTNPRSDGLTWECGDFKSDGTHPNRESGGPKVANLLMEFFKSRSWFVE